MALFGNKKKEEKIEKTTIVAPSPPSSLQSYARNDLSHVLKNPRITEKATMHQEGGVYMFDVALRATKSEVRDAVRALYGVMPRKVHMVPVPSKQKRSVRTGARGIARGGKKAYVYLKKGETITIT